MNDMDIYLSARRRRSVQEAFLSALLRDRHASFSLVNSRSGQVLADTVLRAFDSRTRRKGLLGRERFDEGYALIIAPTNAIHTFFMRFAIDIAFVGRDGTVVAIRDSIKPWRIVCAIRAYAAIELPAGTLRRSATQVGDPLTLTTAAAGRPTSASDQTKDSSGRLR